MGFFTAWENIQFWEAKEVGPLYSCVVEELMDDLEAGDYAMHYEGQDGRRNYTILGAEVNV